MSAGDIAWVLMSSALVLFMTPGLALFYGGMVPTKNVLNMLLKNFVSIPIVTVIWLLVGFSLAFSGSNPLIGGFGAVGFAGLDAEGLLGAMFQLTFAIITPALISGAVAGRIRFSAWVAFTALWALIVYPVVAHWAWAGWLADMGAIDFAGGLVVHINAGIAALAVVLVLGPREGFRAEMHRPHSLPLVLIGTGILWFGWFGFNAGSAFAADGLAINALVTTQVGAAMGALAWMAAEWRAKRTPSLLGAASGAVAGLVAITPAAGFVGPMAALLFGGAAGLLCFKAVNMKFRWGLDDSLDVVGIHLVGGLVGSILLGVFAQASVNGVDGALYGNFGLLGDQLVAVVAVVTFSFGATWLIAKFVDRTLGLRIDADVERRGLDVHAHGEIAYAMDPDSLGEGGGLLETADMLDDRIEVSLERHTSDLGNG